MTASRTYPPCDGAEVVVSDASLLMGATDDVSLVISAVVCRWSPDGSWRESDSPFADAELFAGVSVPMPSDAEGFALAIRRIGATIARLLRERDALRRGGATIARLLREAASHDGPAEKPKGGER